MRSAPCGTTLETAFGSDLRSVDTLRGSRAPSCDFASQSSSLRSSGDLTASPQVHLALRQPDACRRGRMARDHEPWPGGESRRRDLNHRLAAGPQASPAPSSSLCFNPAGFAARQDTNAAQGRTRTRLLRRLHEYQAVFRHKANTGRAVSMKPPITAASSMPPYHVNRDILLPEQQVDCRAMGHVIQFVDICW